MREPQDGGHQHVEHRQLLVDRVVGEALLQAETRVVDQEIDRSTAIGQAGLDPRALLGDDKVGSEHLDLHGVCRSQLVRHSGEPGLVARHEHQVLSASGELVCELEADAGGRAGDESRSHAPSKQVSPRSCQPAAA